MGTKAEYQLAEYRAELDAQVDEIVASVAGKASAMVAACHDYVLTKVREQLTALGFECGVLQPYRNSRHGRHFEVRQGALKRIVEGQC